jgi:hypothetical protein
MKPAMETRKSASGENGGIQTPASIVFQSEMGS